MKSVCLVMVVGSGAESVGPCLGSAKPFVSHWVICDAGANHGMAEVVRESLGSIPGTLHQLAWTDFGQNRTQALKLAKGKADYHLLLDPGMRVEIGKEFRDRLKADSYLVRHAGSVESWVEMLVSDKHNWEFVGPVHEYVRSRSARTREKLNEINLTDSANEGQRMEQCRLAIELLKTSVERGANVARSTFYLAQNYRDTGNLALAVEFYEKRTTMGGWEEEVWYSHYQIARLQQRMGVSWLLVLHKYLEAYQFRPSRIEPLYHVARHYREAGQERLAGLFAKAALGAPYPDDLLYIERAIYEGGLERECGLRP